MVKETFFVAIFVCTLQSKTMSQSFEIGQKLPATPFMVFNSFGVQMCLSECGKYAMCSSLNYNLKHFVCELNSGWKTESLSWISDDEYVYHEIPRPVSVLDVFTYIYYVVFFHHKAQFCALYNLYNATKLGE